jgi:hypothetical protein
MFVAQRSRWFPATLALTLGWAVLLLGGCTQSRVLTISTKPANATIKVDGVDHGRGQVTVPLTFRSEDETHLVTVSRLGYRQEAKQVTLRNFKDPLVIELRPLSRVVTFNITPVPANVFIDGKPVTTQPAQSVSQELEFTVDERNNWITHTVRAERPGFAPAERVVSWVDLEQHYTLTLEPQRKDLTITTDPPGATVTLGGEEVGKTPLTLEDRAFPMDLATNEYLTQELVVTKPGFPPVKRTVSWDDGQTHYAIPLEAQRKTVRIKTNPPGATVSIAGRELERDESGNAIAADLPFPPADDSGKLMTYTATVSHRTPAAEWETREVPIGWDEGQAEYSVVLKEILTRVVPLIHVKMERADGAWQVVPDWAPTLAMKSIDERGGMPKPERISDVRGAIIDSLAVSPDGKRLVFTTLAGKEAASFRSQMMVIDTTPGGGAPQQFTDGKSLDIMPSYTPGGDQIVFSSNRAGRRLSIWSMDANGTPPPWQNTPGETHDLWPVVDADPKPRLYFQSYVETRDDPRLYMMQLGTVVRWDLTSIGGMQPRISPKADRVLFCSARP